MAWVASGAASQQNGPMGVGRGAGYPAGWEADVLLRDGHPVHLRPITAADGDALRAFHTSLSDRTVYFRFFSAKPALTDADVEYFTNVDYDSRVALVALDAGVMVGVGRFDALGDGRAEVAFVIRDDVQGLGLGSVLLEHLAAAARERGIRQFVAEVLPENSRMLATFREAGFDVRQRREEDVLAVRFDIEPTTSSLAVMQAREHRAEARSVHRLLHPARVAVVGASRSPGGLGHELLRHLVSGGFTGDLVAVHPEVEQIAGVRCARSLSSVGEPIDLAVVVVPADQVTSVIEDAEQAGVLGLVVVSGGFGDAGPGGLAVQAELVELVHRTGMRLVGPNALGLINTDPAVRLNASLVTHMPPAGRVGFFSQSGALGGSIIERFTKRGLGLSTFVSAGNRADISGNDLLQYWEEDPDTDLVMLYLETIGNARKFARIVHRLSLAKPVMMVRTGGAGQRHPLGHAVGSTALTQDAVEQVLRDCGLIVVDSIHHMLDVAQVAASQPLPTGTGLAIVGNSDALAVMALNACERTSASVVGQPVTFARQESAEAYVTAIRAALTDSSVHAVLAIYVPSIEHPSGEEIRTALRRCASHVEEGVARKPIIALMVGGETTDGIVAPGDVPIFHDVEDALAALDAVTRYALWRTSPSQTAITVTGGPGAAPGAVAPGPGDYAGEDAMRILPDLNVQVDLTDEIAAGIRVHLVDDALFGPVVIVGVDDPVAELLDDRAYRLAPVSLAGARAMLADLAALSAALPSAASAADLERLALVVSAVSAAPSRNPAVMEIDLRGLRAESGTPDSLRVRDISVTVAGVPVMPEPFARRL
jgi:acyl-CoA synthetase (NDP forming)/GNAT superfamily N-acetyltransferase